jgi:hypothetical protein
MRTTSSAKGGCLATKIYRPKVMTFTKYVSPEGSSVSLHSLNMKSTEYFLLNLNS